MTAVAQLANQELVPGGSNEQVEHHFDFTYRTVLYGTNPHVTTRGQCHSLIVLK